MMGPPKRTPSLRTGSRQTDCRRFWRCSTPKRPSSVRWRWSVRRRIEGNPWKILAFRETLALGKVRRIWMERAALAIWWSWPDPFFGGCSEGKIRPTVLNRPSPGCSAREGPWTTTVIVINLVVKKGKQTNRRKTRTGKKSTWQKLVISRNKIDGQHKTESSRKRIFGYITSLYQLIVDNIYFGNFVKQ